MKCERMKRLLYHHLFSLIFVVAVLQGQSTLALLFPYHRSQQNLPKRVIADTSRCMGHPVTKNTADLLAQQELSFSNPSLDVQFLCRDPLVYVVDNLLSAEECQKLQNYVQRVTLHKDRTMTRSNPPQVSLERSKLWPLLPLSVAAGAPPALKYYTLHSTQNNVVELLQGMLHASLPNMAIALVGSSMLAVTVLTTLRILSASASRTSDAMALNTKEDLLAESIVGDVITRVCSVSHHPWYKFEAPVVTRYRPGAVFARHGDASPSRGSEWADEGGQRVVTCICYLNTVLLGGETYFDQLNIKVRPQQGRALLFFPADETTLQADDRTTHESLPPTDQDKWIVQMFGRVARVPPPLGIPQTDRMERPTE